MCTHTLLHACVHTHIHIHTCTPVHSCTSHTHTHPAEVYYLVSSMCRGPDSQQDPHWLHSLSCDVRLILFQPICHSCCLESGEWVWLCGHLSVAHADCSVVLMCASHSICNRKWVREGERKRNTHTHTCVHTHVHTHTHACMCTHLHVCVHKHTPTHMHTHAHQSTHALHTHTHAHTHTYARTHTHTPRINIILRAPRVDD